MQGNLLTINQPGLTTYVKPNHRGTEFSLEGFTVERDPEHYYCISVYGAKIEGVPEYREPVEIERFLYDYYKTLADTQLRDELNKQAPMCDLLNIADDEVYEHFWNDAISYAGKDQPIESLRSVVLSSISNGLAVAEIGHACCVFDFIKGEHVRFRELHYDKPVETSPLKLFYGRYLLLLIAEEQLSRATCHAAYQELAQLNKFLQDKKSLKIVMKNGAVHDVKPQYGSSVQAFTILNAHFDGSKMVFALNNHYDIKPRFEQRVSLMELDYLQYGRNKYAINADALDMPIRKK